MHTRPPLYCFIPAKPSTVATAVLLCMGTLTTPAWSAEDATLPTVVIQATPESEANASIAGFAKAPAWQAPMQAHRFGTETLEQAQVQRLADVTKLDASTTDAYNTTGYWDYLSMRGFVLDNKSNYRREGLPINAETRIGLDNKAGIEIFKGTSGLQAGISAPGGLVNFLVKRPDARVRQAALAFTGGSSVKAAVDLSDRFGEQAQYGLRVNAAVEHLDPNVQAANGQRRLLALAGQWQVTPQSSLDIEFEDSMQRQPSVPGFSALGNTLPRAGSIDPATNLNQQAWTLPVDLRGQTGSIRWQQKLNANWRTQVQYGEQHLTSDDRAAFPFGCDAVGQYDRFCSDGTVDIYDFRSENEKRTTRALQAKLIGQIQVGQINHDLQLGILRSTHHTDQSTQLFNYPPVGAIPISSPSTPLNPDTSTPGSVVADRVERSTELSVADAIKFNEQWRAWLGVRHTHLYRQSSPTDGSVSTERAQDITTPWAAVGYTFAPKTQAYLSWGEGAEMLTAPSFGGSNNNQVMPAVKSRQLEIGVKGDAGSQQWGVSAFHIQRLEMAVVNATYQLDGTATHQGVEGYWQWQSAQWGSHLSAMALHTQRDGSASGVNGMSATNVPDYSVKWSGQYMLPSNLTAGLRTTGQLDVVHEGPRWADPDNTLRIRAWTRVDASVEAVQAWGNQAITWRVGVTNLLDSRAWRESPYSFDHIWLFPMAARTFTASAKIDF